MNQSELKIRLAYISGLKDIVRQEISHQPIFVVVGEGEDCLYLNFIKDFPILKNLRSASRVYLVVQNSQYNPLYISKHKSVLGNLIDVVLNNGQEKFKTFKIACAGFESPEVRAIAAYIHDTYKLSETEDADLKVHIIKIGETWEIGLQTSARPLSVRDYKEKNMSGAMDSTIAYAANSLGALDSATSYLNIFSGSGTLLIEAAKSYPNLKQLIGFDNEKSHISLAIQNIKKAGLIKRIQIKEYDIFSKPDLGKFDVIVSDLPFGMVISKNMDLEKLYRCFLEYCEETLKPEGQLVVYTSQYNTLKKLISKSQFKIIKTMDLKLMTAANSYLRPKIFLCRLRQKRFMKK